MASEAVRPDTPSNSPPRGTAPDARPRLQNATSDRSRSIYPATTPWRSLCSCPHMNHPPSDRALHPTVSGYPDAPLDKPGICAVLGQEFQYNCDQPADHSYPDTPWLASSASRRSETDRLPSAHRARRRGKPAARRIKNQGTNPISAPNGGGNIRRPVSGTWPTTHPGARYVRAAPPQILVAPNPGLARPQPADAGLATLATSHPGRASARGSAPVIHRCHRARPIPMPRCSQTRVRPVAAVT